MDIFQEDFAAIFGKMMKNIIELNVI